MNVTISLLTISSALLTFMTILWIISVRIRNAGIVDLVWGPAFALVAWASWFAAGRPDVPAVWIVNAMVTLWGCRLGLHLWHRNVGHGEDFRYATWRKETGPSYWWKSLFTVFLFQGVLILIIGAPLIGQNLVATPVRPLLPLGIALWLAGVIIEAVADLQLQRFRATRKTAEEVLDTGLWRYSRHPNYFGDALVWWGLALASMTDVGDAWMIVSPILMTVFLRFISGVTLLERTLAARKPGYRDYMARTSPFMLRPPKRRTDRRGRTTSLLLLACALGVASSSLASTRDGLLCGETSWRYLGLIPVFDIRLERPASAACAFPFPDSEPAELELTYRVSIDRDDFVEITRRGICTANPPEVCNVLQSPLQRWNALYQDIASGDRYRIRWEPRLARTCLFKNDKRLGCVTHPHFGPALLAIWLGPDGMDRRLRNRLTARR